MKLYNDQLTALKKMKNGCILCGAVGSGKSITALAYYYLQHGGSELTLKGGVYHDMKTPSDLYIVTTAKKRDLKEWESEMAPFLLSTNLEISKYKNTVVVDSWNNITKYKDVKNAFFIFDEQRLVGRGVWVKTFLKIAKENRWILLSGTPGDSWSDYVPVFIANGFYHNRSEFERNHVIWEPHVTFPKIRGWMNEGRLILCRNEILVKMADKRKTIPHHERIFCEYDKELYKKIFKERWNPFDDKPIENPSQWAYLQRKVVNLDESRELALLELLENHERAIIFYNFDYELERLRLIIPSEFEVCEWNGHKHESIPDSKKWVFLVQYAAGSEGWNCITTDTIIFYSESYSYRIMTQAAGRIDRINTPYIDLYYYHLTSKSYIDLRITRSLSRKKNFNQKSFIKLWEGLN